MSNFYIHPKALVETNKIGANSKVWAFTHIMEDVRIGKNCNIGDHCFIESGVVVGNNVTIKNGNMLFQGVTLENGVFVGPHVFFTNDLYPRSPRLHQAKQRYSTKAWLAPTLVKHGASLGAGAVLLAGIVVGEFAMVGAGAIVTKDIPPYSLVIGNPSRFAGWVCQCGQKIIIRGKEGNCNACGRSYYKGNSQLNIREVDA